MHIVDYTGHPEAERVLILMGSGAQTAAQTVAALTARGERVGVIQVRLYRPFPAEALLAALPADGAHGRRAGPHQRTRLTRRAAVPRRRRRARPRRTAGVSARVLPRVMRRTLRPVLEGVHAGNGRRRVRRTGTASSRVPASPSASTTTSRGISIALRPDVRHRADRHDPRGVLRPGFRRHRRRQQEHHQDPRRRARPATPRAISSTTRKNPARRRFRICASGPSRSRRRIWCPRPTSSAATSSRFLDKADVLGRAAPGAALLLNCRAPAR